MGHLYAAMGEWVGESEFGAVAVARTSDDTLVRLVELPTIANDAAPSPDGQRLYAAGGNGKLYVLSR
jgi:hypothetical protein